MAATTISLDEFQALEARVLQAVELIRKEREARASAEAERDDLRQKLQQAEDAQAAAVNAREVLQSELDALRAANAEAANTARAEVEAHEREREAVRLRVEKMLSQMDELL